MINCKGCDFVCKNMTDFNTHKMLIHPNNCIRCRICGETFETKSNLMIHRKKEHVKTVAKCQNYPKGECRFSSKTCWWIHDSQAEPEKIFRDMFKCYNF